MATILHPKAGLLFSSKIRVFFFDFFNTVAISDLNPNLRVWYTFCQENGLFFYAAALGRQSAFENGHFAEFLKAEKAGQDEGFRKNHDSIAS